MNLLNLYTKLNVRLAEGNTRLPDVSTLPKIDDDKTIIPTVLNIFFIVLGGVSLIVIIISGIRLMTSSGDPQAVTKARNTIIYAAVGLAISISAFTIVSVVVGQL